jgi:hypothetical protein
VKCFECQKEIEIGDHYIEDTPSGFLKTDDIPGVDELIAELFGGHGNKIILCLDCTSEGGDYLLETFYGDDPEEATG